MDTVELLQRLSVSLAVGLLIGIERGWQARDEPEGDRAAGLRTHTLSALLGGLWAALAAPHGAGGLVAVALAFITFGGAMTLFRYRETTHEGTFGATTLMASFLAFVLGAYAVLGDAAVAAASGVAVTILLALKAALHGWVARLSWAELRSGLVLLAMTFILLPLLPDRTIDPWGAVNPFELWLMTVALAALSFAGYVAMKVAGGRGGSVIIGIAGGLASSTAVTLTLSRLARDHDDQVNHLLAGILLAGATMMARVLAVVVAINAGLLSRLGLPLGLAALTLAVIGGALLWLPQAGKETASDAIQLDNPIELDTVLRLGAILVVVTVLAKVLTGVAGATGAYVLAALSGVADVDAVTLSMARLGGGELSADVASRAIGIVVAVNTLAKAVLGWVSGGARIGQRLMAASVAALVVGFAAFAHTPTGS